MRRRCASNRRSASNGRFRRHDRSSRVPLPGAVAARAGEEGRAPRRQARRFIAGSPFCLLATADADGRCDVSPRGGPPGFVRTLDEHRLAIPDLSGNNLLDSLTNVVANPHAGLLFVIPGRDETLRVEGTACLTTDPDGARPLGRRAAPPEGRDRGHRRAPCTSTARSRSGAVGSGTPQSWAELAGAPDICDVIIEQVGMDARSRGRPQRARAGLCLRPRRRNGRSADAEPDSRDRGTGTRSHARQSHRRSALAQRSVGLGTHGVERRREV